MASQKHERIVGQGDDAIRIVAEGGVGGTSDADIEFLKIAGTIVGNFFQVLDKVKKQEGDIGLLAGRAKKLLRDKKCLVWVGKPGEFIIPDPGVTAAYLYPDAESAIPAIMVSTDSIKSKELLRDSETWDPETFKTVGLALLSLALGFDNLKNSNRRALTEDEFNTISYKRGLAEADIQPFGAKLELQ